MTQTLKRIRATHAPVARFPRSLDSLRHSPHINSQTLDFLMHRRPIFVSYNQCYIVKVFASCPPVAVECASSDATYVNTATASATLVTIRPLHSSYSFSRGLSSSLHFANCVRFRREDGVSHAIPAVARARRVVVCASSFYTSAPRTLPAPVSTPTRFATPPSHSSSERPPSVLRTIPVRPPHIYSYEHLPNVLRTSFGHPFFRRPPPAARAAALQTNLSHGS